MVCGYFGLCHPEGICPKDLVSGWLRSYYIMNFFKWLITKEKWSDKSKAARFYATDACDGCKLCYDECPTGHIKWINERPEWEKPCLMCAACSTVCPSGAIEYGIVPDNSGDKK